MTTEGAREPSTRLKVGGPDAVKIVVCDSCTRTSLFQPLRTRHFGVDGLCSGPIREVIYSRFRPDKEDL